LIFTDLKGFPIFLTKSYPGCLCDLTLGKLGCNLIDIGDNYLAFDRGGYGLQDIYNVCLPTKGISKEFYSGRHENYDNEHKSIRIVVENFFCHIKKFKILKNILDSMEISLNY
jgi:hypothetical protein